MKTTSSKKWGALFGLCSIIALLLNTLLCSIPIFIIGVGKLFPNQRWRIYCTLLLDQMAIFWNKFNSAYVNRFFSIEWHVTGNLQFDRNSWYLVIPNHQSALDIFIVQHIFCQKIPPLKFFVKSQLKWVPVFGFVWWVMGFPFMKRYSKEYLKKHPHKKGTDLETTRKALQLFKHYPASILSFIEGTRLNPKKQQQSPYKHLLKPKAGGIQQVIYTLGGQLQPIIDVSIVFPTKKHSLWDFLCHRVNAIYINVRSIPIPEEFTNSTTSLTDADAQNAFRTWLNEQWAIKDALITEMKKSLGSRPE